MKTRWRFFPIPLSSGFIRLNQEQNDMLMSEKVSECLNRFLACGMNPACPRCRRCRSLRDSRRALASSRELSGPWLTLRALAWGTFRCWLSSRLGPSSSREFPLIRPSLMLKVGRVWEVKLVRFAGCVLTNQLLDRDCTTVLLRQVLRIDRLEIIKVRVQVRALLELVGEMTEDDFFDKLESWVDIDDVECFVSQRECTLGGQKKFQFFFLFAIVVAFSPLNFCRSWLSTAGWTR